VSPSGGSAGDVIQAAGGIVWRRVAGDDAAGKQDADPVAPPDDRKLQVLVIHRVKRNDWGWPKGKAEPEDDDAQATATREVLEETGLHCRLGSSLGSISYVVDGRPKIVRYWAMEVEDGTFAPNREVDRIEWLTPADARSRVDYALDREVLDRFLDVADHGR
jgi:8-oxo-dGTP diphosphatase